MSSEAESEPSEPWASVGSMGVLARLLAVQFAFGLGVSAFLLLPKHLAANGATGSSLGAITSAMSVAIVVTTPLSAWLAERVAPARLALFGSILLAASSLGFHGAREPGPLMLMLRSLQGVAFSLTLTATSILAANGAPPRRLAHRLGLLGAAMLATQAVAPALLEPVTERFGWNMLYTVAASSAVLAALMTWALPRGIGVSQPEIGQPQASPRSSAVLRPSVEASAVMGFAFGAVITFAPALALQRGAVSIGPLFMGYTIAALAIRVFGGGLGDALGHARVSVGSLLGYALVVLAFTQLRPGLLPWLGAGLGLSHGLMYPSLNALVLADTPPHRRGRVQAFFFGSFHFGIALGGVVLGGAAELVGYSGVFVLAAALVVTIAIRLGSAARHALGPEGAASAPEL